MRRSWSGQFLNRSERSRISSDVTRPGCPSETLSVLARSDASSGVISCTVDLKRTAGEDSAAGSSFGGDISIFEGSLFRISCCPSGAGALEAMMEMV